jgi:hypothetical protein
VIELLKHERGRLDALAHALLERETLDQLEAYEVASVELPAVDASEEPKTTPSPYRRTLALRAVRRASAWAGRRRPRARGARSGAPGNPARLGRRSRRQELRT